MPLLKHLILQDIASGTWVGVIDPHGDLIDDVLSAIPAHRAGDVGLLDPSDVDWPVGCNVLKAHSEFEKHLLASDLISVFRRLSTSWGDQMNSVLQNALLAFFESSQGGTLADLRRFLLDAKFRNRFLETVDDPEIVYYWRSAWPKLGAGKSLGPVLTRLELFLSPKMIRNMVAQPDNRLDFADIMDRGKILLVRLPQGQMGRENCWLFGSLLFAKIQQTALARQRLAQEDRQAFFLYVDEFQNFLTPSVGEILSGARKYGLGLILAHQELQQLERDRDIASAVLSNTHTRVVFGVGENDARALAKGFAHFGEEDILNLGRGEALCRLGRADHDFNLAVPPPPKADATEGRTRYRRAVEASRSAYATPRNEVEAAIRRTVEELDRPEPTESKKTAAKPKPTPEPPEKPSAAPTAVPAAAAKPPEPAAPESATPEPTPPVPENEQTPVPPAPSVAEPVASKPVRSTELGKGGPTHKLMQQRLREVGHELGYLVTLEKPISGTKENIDVVLECARRTFACEISVTTDATHESANVIKCLRAGFASVVVIAREKGRRNAIRERLREMLDGEAFAKVLFFEVEEFVAHLKGLAGEDAMDPPGPEEPPAPEVKFGRKILRKYTSADAAENAPKEKLAIDAISRALMDRKQRKG